MKKRLLLTSTAVVAIALGVVGMSAFEAHIINVTAQIENALAVSTNEILFGTVFPQETFVERMDIRLSGSFLTEDRVDDISYILKQKPKPRPDVTQPTPSGEPIDEFCHNWLPEDFGDPGDPANEYYIFCYPSLCPYLSKHDADTEDGNDDLGVPALHDPGVTLLGHLGKAEGDIIDLWDIDLVVPCFEEHCAQDWPAFVAANNPDADPGAFKLDPRLNSSVFGCDLWFEVTGISLPQNTFCGDGIVQTPNDTGTGGPNNDGNEECDTSDPIPCVDQDGYDGERDCTDCTLGECETDEFCGDQIVNGPEQCESDAECDDGDPNTTDTCTACACLNEQNTGTITITKIVVNNGVGTLSAGNFQMEIDGSDVPQNTPNVVSEGLRAVGEEPEAGYVMTFTGGDCDSNGQINVVAGQDYTCEVTNEFEAGTITVIKVVENNGLGTAVAGDFQMEIDGSDVAQNTAIPVTVGNHTVGEEDDLGYDVSFSGDCDSNGDVNIADGEDKTCTVTNEFLVGELTVTKVVTNNDGGNNVIGDFQLRVDTTNVNSGDVNLFAVGTYTVNELGVGGYDAIFTGDCDGDGIITINADDVLSCTVTNDDIRPNITLIKSVINDDSGSATPGDFTMRLNGVFLPTGSSRSVDANTAHTINEDAESGYSFDSITGDPECPAVLGGTATLDEGEAITCTIINDDDPV